ncbi:MAG: hypothetical protein KJ732_06365 [Candidatus Margulisbacteria bacterium]|nr:hypothetical protein [Candidatus Margulisiibacteriota bacterium]
MYEIDGKRRVGFRICLLTLSFLLGLSISAQAIRLEISSSNLPEGIAGPVELMRIVGSYDPPGGGDDVRIRLVNIVDGRLVDEEIPITVSGRTIPLASGGVEKTPGALDDISQGTKLYIRVWQDGTIAQGKYYAKSDIKTITWLETDPKVDWPITSWTKYLADVPQGVGVKVNSEALQRTGASLVLTLGIAAIDNGQTEIRSSQLEISKSSAFSDVDDPTGGQKKFSADSASVSGDYYTAGTYYLRSQKTNYYGSTPGTLLTGPVRDISGPGESVVDAVGKYATLGGGIGGGGTFTFDLKATQADKLIVNSIAIPARTLSDGAIYKVSELAAYINGKADKVVVTAISKWDPAAGQAVGVTFDGDGNLVAGADDFAIDPGVGYQVFTTEDVNITFLGI